MYLIDTNIFLEALLEQEKTDVVRSFLSSTNVEYMFITDLTLHSIGIILFKLKKDDLFLSFLDNVIINGVSVIYLNEKELKKVSEISKSFNLDFDDAYQYAVAEKYDLQIISFDRDFDNTLRKRKEPNDIFIDDITNF